MHECVLVGKIIKQGGRVVFRSVEGRISDTWVRDKFVAEGYTDRHTTDSREIGGYLGRDEV